MMTIEEILTELRYLFGDVHQVLLVPSVNLSDEWHYCRATISNIHGLGGLTEFSAKHRTSYRYALNDAFAQLLAAKAVT